MTKEVRNNVIFFALFMAISLPGAVMLFKKKLDPEAAPMYLPKPTPNEAAYMHPIEVPTRVARVMPAGVEAWTDGLTATYFAQLQPNLDALPPMSERRVVEVLAASENEVGLLIWADAGLLESDAGPVAFEAVLDVPADVVKGIKNVGYPLPPKRVVLARLSADAPGVESAQIRWAGGEDRLSLAGVWPEKTPALPSADKGVMNADTTPGEASAALD